jgi:hypothetical protein
LPPWSISTVYIDPGTDFVGTGWMFTILGLILIVNNICLSIIVKKGPQWKQNRKDRQNNPANFESANKNNWFTNFIRKLHHHSYYVPLYAIIILLSLLSL